MRDNRLDVTAVVLPPAPNRPEIGRISPPGCVMDFLSPTGLSK